MQVFTSAAKPAQPSIPLAPLAPAGRFARDSCPSYLTPAGFATLKGGALDALTIVNGFFLPTLRARQYTKVRGKREGAMVGCKGC